MDGPLHRSAVIQLGGNVRYTITQTYMIALPLFFDGAGGGFSSPPRPHKAMIKAAAIMATATALARSEY